MDDVLTGSVVAVVGLVVHDKLIVDEVETVGFRGKGVHDHLLRRVRVDAGEVVDVLAGVLGVGHAEPEVKVERFEVAITEEVPLDHAEVFHGLVTHRELHRGTDGAQFQELGSELVSGKIMCEKII